MKIKKILFVTIIIVVSTMINLNTYAASENQLIDYLKQATDQPIVATFYDDFDKNGSYEMFAITGNKNYDNTMNATIVSGSIWYVNELFSQLNFTNDLSNKTESNFILDSAKIIDLGSEKHFYIDEFYTTGNNTLVYKAHIGTPQLHCGKINYINNDNIIITHSTLDVSSDGTGRSTKDYWFKWSDTNRCYEEYGGIPITRQQFLMFDGANEILANINADNITYLYRGNGIININTSNYDATSTVYTYNYYTLKYEGNKVSLYEQDGGYYLDALVPELAVYPEFKFADKYNNYIEIAVKKANDMYEGLPNGGAYEEEGQPLRVDDDGTIVDETNDYCLVIITTNGGAALACLVDKNAEECVYITGCQDYGEGMIEDTILSEYRTNHIDIYINNKRLTSTNAYIENATTMIAMRPIFEALGANVYWNGELKQIKATKNDTELIMYIGNKEILINGQSTQLAVAPTIKDGSTMIPLRVVSEALGAGVVWHSDTKTIEILY